jgi:hypothetical protein
MRAEQRPEREETAAAVREQLQAAEAGIDVPDGLWSRVSAPREGPAAVPAPAPHPLRRTVPAAVMIVAAAAVAFVILGTWWLVSPPSGSGPAHSSPPSRASGSAVALRVHNAEKPCRNLHTLECSLRVAKNPYAVYAAPGNAAGRVWHGDKLSATCVVTDGHTVTDEKGISSARWYKVVKAKDGGRGVRFEGWLPGVRTRNTTEVPVCSGAEKPPRSES